MLGKLKYKLNVYRIFRFNQELFFIDAVDILRETIKYIALSRTIEEKNIKILFIETAKSKIIKNLHQKKIKILKFFPCSSKLLSAHI